MGTGREQKTFSIIENILVHQSFKFASLCDATWKHGGRIPIEMPDVDPDIFAMFRSWILGNDIPSFRDAIDVGILQGGVRHDAVELYILAHKMRVNGLKDWIVSILIWGQEIPYFGIENIVVIYANLPEGAKLRKLVVDCWIATSPWRLSQDDYKSFREEQAASAPTFVIELVERFSRIEPHSENEDPQAQLPNIQEGVCRYHEHAEDGFCPWNTGPNRLRLLGDDDDDMWAGSWKSTATFPRESFFFFLEW